MSRCTATVAVFLLMLLASGCRSETANLLQTIECWAFSSSGVTLLSNPGKVSIKELRLSGNKLDADVIIEGQVVERSENGTFFVITDDSARMLVVTTDVTPRMSEVVFKGAPGAMIRVVGRVEIGKKGLPFLKATAMTNAGIEDVSKSKT